MPKEQKHVRHCKNTTQKLGYALVVLSFHFWAEQPTVLLLPLHRWLCWALKCTYSNTSSQQDTCWGLFVLVELPIPPFPPIPLTALTVSVPPPGGACFPGVWGPSRGSWGCCLGLRMVRGTGKQARPCIKANWNWNDTKQKSWYTHTHTHARTKLTRKKAIWSV